MITFEIGQDLALIQKTARELAKRELRPKNRDAEAEGRAPHALVAQYQELGLAAIELDEAHGGLGLGLVGRAIVEEELAWGDLPLALAMPSPGAFAQAVLLFGTEEQRATFIPRIVERGARGVVAWSEPKPTPGSFSTIADEQADGGWRITGTKSEIVCGDDAAAAVVFARARFRSGAVQPAAFVIDLEGASDPARGVRFGARVEGLGLQAAPTVDLVLEGVKVDAGARLSGADHHFDAAVMALFARMGIVGAARSVGLARAALETARAYAADRQAFGKPIAHFQGLAFLIADMATRVEVMRGVVHRAGWGLDRGERDATKLAAMAIAECHEGAMYVTNNAVQVLGGAGFIQDFPVEKWMRDAKSHMAWALTHQGADLFVGRLALEGGAPLLEDAPMPELQTVMT